MQRAVGSTQEGVEHKPHIAALDGLRFLAAFLVMAGHGYWYIILRQNPDNLRGPMDQLITGLAAPGMTLFFVLSGFVIHLNYRDSLSQGARGAADFFIARFARLYPLFFIVFMCDFIRLLWEGGYFSGEAFKTFDIFAALPLHLTFTQTWWLWPVGPEAAYQVYGTPSTGITGLTWSLSTEAFFYAVYIAIAGRVLVRLGGRHLVIAGAAIAAAGWLYYLGFQQVRAQMPAFSQRHFPNIPPHELGHWVLWLSPWGRIWEFLLGAVAAQAYVLGMRFRRGNVVLIGASAAITLAFMLFFTSSNGYRTYGMSLSGGLFALAIFAFATTPSAFLTRIFASRPLVLQGEASYSLFLLHYFVIHEFGLRLAGRVPAIPSAVIYFGGMALSMLVARISYRLIEDPARRWIRRNFRPLRLDVAFVTSVALIVLFSRAASLPTVALRRAEAVPVPGHISVVSASFGDNCKSELRDNIKGLLARTCNGERACQFVYDIAKLRDPVGGCAKRFVVDYHCGDPREPLRFNLEPFDKPRMTIALGCPAR